MIGPGPLSFPRAFRGGVGYENSPAVCISKWAGRHHRLDWLPLLIIHDSRMSRKQSAPVHFVQGQLFVNELECRTKLKYKLKLISLYKLSKSLIIEGYFFGKTELMMTCIVPHHQQMFQRNICAKCQ